MLAIAMLAACSPAVRVTTFRSELPPPRPTDHAISIYYSKLPSCDFNEIGLLSASPRSRFTSMAEVQARMVAEARKMGGDALVNVSDGSEVSGGGEYISSERVIKGTVVRFTDPSCREPMASVSDLE